VIGADELLRRLIEQQLAVVVDGPLQPTRRAVSSGRT
jgi:hypothetical protein